MLNIMLIKAFKMKKHNLVILVCICVVKCLAMSQSELEDFSNFLEVTSRLDLNVKSKGPDDEYDEDEPVSDHAWEESGKFEGDLILNERQRRLLVADVAEGLSRNGLQDSTKRWPNNEVIYYIQREHFSSGQMQAIQDGIDDLAQASCVKFTPYKKGDRDAVVIQGSRRGCFSQVGYQGGYQVLNLSGRHPVGRGCFRHGTVVHELLHALGFYHMQSSPDRDDYINVLWQNIIQPARHNFRKYNSFSVSDFGVGYDYESVLHYSRKAFSANGQDTLVPKQSGAEIGQRVGLSQKDIQKLNRMYCDADSNDSNNSDDESTPKKPAVDKKKSKNKAFEGHGIGYHQGKTVVIKLKPTVELYRLPTVPKFHMFDYFSKAPEAMSPTPNQRSGIGKEMTYMLRTSGDIVDYEPVPRNLKTQIQGENEEENIDKRINIQVLSDELHLRTESNIGKNTVSSPKPKINSSKFSEEMKDDIDVIKFSDISYTYPNSEDFNRNYSKYYNPIKIHEKEPETVKVDKLFASHRLPHKDVYYGTEVESDLKTVRQDFQSYFKEENGNNKKNPSLLHKDVSLPNYKFEDIYTPKNYHYNPSESSIPEFKSSLKYSSGQPNINDTDDETYISLKTDFPLNEDWYTNDKYKQNPNKNYDKESYTRDSEGKKESNAGPPIGKYYYIPENIHHSEMNQGTPYSLFGAPVPLTQKWFTKDSSNHKDSQEQYFIKDNR